MRCYATRMNSKSYIGEHAGANLSLQTPIHAYSTLEQCRAGGRVRYRVTQKAWCCKKVR